MKSICNISGKVLSSNPDIIGFFKSASIVHPIFTLTNEDINRIIDTQYLSGNLTNESIILLSLALLNNAQLIIRKNNACFNWQGLSRNANLFRLHIIDIQSISNFCLHYESIGQLTAGKVIDNYLFDAYNRLILPRIMINHDSHIELLSLSKLSDMITLWNDLIDEFKLSLVITKKQEKINRALIEIKANDNQITFKKRLKRINLIADYAILASNAPRTTIPINGENISLSDYWHNLIIACFIERDNNNSLPVKLYNYSIDDIKELLEYMLDNLPSNQYSNIVIDTLKTGLNHHRQFFIINTNRDYNDRLLEEYRNNPNIAIEPNKYSFANKTDYFAALAKYREITRVLSETKESSETKEESSYVKI